MTNEYAREVGLLRLLVKNIDHRALPDERITQEYMLREGLQHIEQKAGGITSIRVSAHESFVELAECIVETFPEIARGALFSNVQSELLGFLERIAIQGITEPGVGQVTLLYSHFSSWFNANATTRREFIPCVISPWAAPKFKVGRVEFVFIEDIKISDFYPPATPDDKLNKFSFDSLLDLMREAGANWIARVIVDGCEQQRAKEIGDIAVDLAIVALQLAAPYMDTRAMCRLDARRGFTSKRGLSEVDGYYNSSWSRMEPGLAIGTGTLQSILQNVSAIIHSVGEIVDGFTAGRFRLPNLERAWCDAAYWYHEALTESIDSIAVAKLETALEVLMRSEGSSGSKTRLLRVLDYFFSLQPDDQISPASKLTARQFAEKVVQDRSRVLHGTRSTLSARMERDRRGLEIFVADVIRKAALNLTVYAKAEEAKDEIEEFLDWLKIRTVLRHK